MAARNPSRRAEALLQWLKSGGTVAEYRKLSQDKKKYLRNARKKLVYEKNQRYLRKRTWENTIRAIEIETGTNRVLWSMPYKYIPEEARHPVHLLWYVTIRNKKAITIEELAKYYDCSQRIITKHRNIMHKQVYSPQVKSYNKDLALQVRRIRDLRGSLIKQK